MKACVHFFDGLNQLTDEEAEEFAKKIKVIEQRADEHNQPFEETWKNWQPSNQHHSSQCYRSELCVPKLMRNQDTLVVVHHPELGSIGLVAS